MLQKKPYGFFIRKKKIHVQKPYKTVLGPGFKPYN